jgi:hypothetical protein
MVWDCAGGKCAGRRTFGGAKLVLKAAYAGEAELPPPTLLLKEESLGFAQGRIMNGGIPFHRSFKVSLRLQLHYERLDNFVIHVRLNISRPLSKLGTRSHRIFG